MRLKSTTLPPPPPPARPDETNVAREHTLPFLYEETTIVLRARLTRKVRQTHEQNGAWTVPLWFLGSRLVCSSKIIATFLAIRRLPSSKVLKNVRTADMNQNSLSIRRFWGKGERWKRKRKRAEGEREVSGLPFSSPPPPPPSKISSSLAP